MEHTFSLHRIHHYDEGADFSPPYAAENPDKCAIVIRGDGTYPKGPCQEPLEGMVQCPVHGKVKSLSL